MYRDQPKSCGIGTGNVPRTQAQVEDQLAALDKTIYRLSEMADRLEGRLSGVVRQEECGKDAGCGVPEQCLVPVAELVRGYKSRVASVADRLDSPFLRIEL